MQSKIQLSGFLSFHAALLANTAQFVIGFPPYLFSFLKNSPTGYWFKASTTKQWRFQPLQVNHIVNPAALFVMPV